MSQDLEGGIITPHQHFEAARQNATETFGAGWQGNFSLMKMVAPRFISVIETDGPEEETQAQRYQLSKVAYNNGTLTYSLTPPFGSPLPYLEINQERGKEGFIDASVYMYKSADFPSIREERKDRGMIDHFSNTAGGKAQYLESLTNAYRYLQKYGLGLENCQFPFVEEAVHADYPQIHTLMQRGKETIRRAHERAQTLAINDVSPLVTETVKVADEEGQEGESVFMRRVKEIVNGLYPSGEIGGFGRYILLAAGAYDNPTEVDDMSRWMWRDNAEFALENLNVASFMESMLNSARKKPGILGISERLFIVSSPPMWEIKPEEYITLVAHAENGENHIGSMHILNEALSGGDVRSVFPGSPSHIGLFPREWIDVELERAINLQDYSNASQRQVTHSTIVMHETIGGQIFNRPLNLEII